MGGLAPELAGGEYEMKSGRERIRTVTVTSRMLSGLGRSISMDPTMSSLPINMGRYFVLGERLVRMRVSQGGSLPVPLVRV
jgi:hypothetical protein